MCNITGILCGMITKDARCIREVKDWIVRAKATFESVKKCKSVKKCSEVK